MGVTVKNIYVACVTFETVKITNPVKEIGPFSRIYLFHYSDGSDDSRIYDEFYDEVVTQLKTMHYNDKNIIKEEVKHYNFTEAMHHLLNIMKSETSKGNRVIVNVSAGSSQFTAAATMACMMVPNCKAMTVSTKEYMVSKAEARKTYFSKEGRPVGLTKDTWPVKELPTYSIDIPPRDLVRGLRVMADIFSMKNLARGLSPTDLETMQGKVSYNDLVHAFEQEDNKTQNRGMNKIWNYESKEPLKTRTMTDRARKLTQSEKMYLMRHFIDEWIRRGWVEKVDGKKGWLRITPSGKNVVDIFHYDPGEVGRYLNDSKFGSGALYYSPY